MSADLVKSLNHHAGSQVGHWEDWAQKADTLMREAADRIATLEAAEAHIASVRDESVEAAKAVATCLPLIAAEARSLRAAQRSAKERELKTKFAVRAEHYERMEFALKRLPAPPAPKQEGA